MKKLRCWAVSGLEAADLSGRGSARNVTELSGSFPWVKSCLITTD